MIKHLGRLINVYIRPYWGLLALVVGLQVIATAMNLYLPTLNARIIDEGVIVGDTDYIWRTGGVMLALSAIQAATQIGATWAASRPKPIDVQQVQMLVHMTCVMLIGAPIMMAGGVIMAVREDFGLTWIILVAVVILGSGIVVLITFMGPLFKRMQERIDNLNRILREQITGVRVVRAFVREEHESRRFDGANDDLTTTTLHVGRLMVFMFPFVGVVMNLSTVGVMWFGAHRISSGDLQIGQLTAFISYLMQILISVMMTTMLLVLAPRAAVCADRIMEVLRTESSVEEPKHPVQEPAERGVVHFDDVSFAYPGADAPVLKHLTFTAEPGQTTAIIGSTGAGKSTLVNLIPRLFDVTGGRVLVDGVDAVSYTHLTLPTN